jgi:TonB family protein
VEPSPQLAEAQLADKSAGPVKKPKPIYPKNALRMGIGGRVLARLTVNDAGHVTHAAIIESAPKNVFDKAVLDAVTQYEFLPEGKTFQADQEIIFELGEDE